MTQQFDPISLEIYWSRLISVSDESAAALLRTAFSTVVRESNDFTTVLMDADCNCLSENTAGIPSFVGMLPSAVRSFLEHIPREEWRPGDCIITNDPEIGSGHLPDITMAAPIFYKGKLVGFSGSIAHLPDIGGAGWAGDCRELFEEGLRLMPVKFIDGGRENAFVTQLIRHNVRAPDQVIGDIYAQVSAQRVCAAGVQQFLDDTGMDDLVALSAELRGRAESAMRKAIADLPDGSWTASVTADGFDADETQIQCCLTINGSDIEIDFGGTSPQINRGINSVLKYTTAYANYPIKCALDPESPRNEGSFQSITVKAPHGSILNPVFPAPVAARQLTGHLLTGAIYGCLAQIVPDLVVAESGSAPTLRAVFGGKTRDGQSFNQVLFASGGLGASSRMDGYACTAFPSNTGAGSIEVLESVSPLLVRHKELAQDSGGVGTHRGGLGQDIILDVLSDAPINISLLSDRHKYPPEGLMGGGAGSKSVVALADGTRLHPKSRSVLSPGAQLHFHYPGGGGFGPPGERDPAAIKRDIAYGYVSQAAAKRDYGATE
ncbi:acetophenone carboxylase delta subunit (plasmid) [Antarctobacter heliothermus]|uniref:Acetophenone carboxylase delta subunit n=1 Tax=Antarctobacter heliothermus TaxID=74033 RepID=A0A222EBD5_9RHOB|nr:hydantoinase B/oxoprolinase family protein [Antarctobacter heliothermus]ASP23493.1 acetophenone carboxylase delta subunit [Antarctobacter heliothermus]